MGRKVIDILKALDLDDSAMICKPVTNSEVEQCQMDLKEMALESIPNGYIDFLKLSNGFSWNGIEFYSTYRVTDPETNYMLLDIVSANDEFNDLYQLDHLVLLGKEDEDYYAYNISNGLYEILERESRQAMEEFKTFDELFVKTVGTRLK